ncbi:MAG: exosortase A [Gammaproteobacteria bacterium]|nr:exosortase A [Gammaproteobacteria bacterium]
MSNVGGASDIQPLNQQWRETLPRLLIATLVFGALFWDSLASMVSIWWRSDTFAHGFLILPISAWLIWRLKHQLVRLSPQPTLLAVPLIATVGFAWIIARFTDIAVGEQLTTVALFIVLMFAILGWQVTKAIVFPLGFLFLAVPMGEDLIPPMMNFTADFTVAMLKLTGIPVFREGTFFEIPSGRWSVVEGCSGVRYLIASITLGVLYAYLMYRSLHRRLIFVAVSVVVPVIANGLRAYMIVMIAHLSDMRLALGVDHLIYGWVFFGVVIMLLFWIGQIWREDDQVAAPTNISFTSQETASVSGEKKVLVAALLAIALWPAWAWMSERNISNETVNLQAVRHPDWVEAADFTDWRPEIVGMDQSLIGFYQGRTGSVMLDIAYYSDQRPGAELVNSQNVMVRQKHPVWRQIGRSFLDVQATDKTIGVQRVVLDSAQQHLLVYHWNWFEGIHSSNDLEIKLHEALARLAGRPRRGAVIVIAVPYADRPEEAAPLLESFIRDALPAIERSLQEAAHG